MHNSTYKDNNFPRVMTERGKYVKDYLTDGFFGGIDFENKL